VLAHLASLWYRLGDRCRADRAISYLTRRQSVSGGWSENWGRGSRGIESAWVIKHYLNAVQWQASSHFMAAGADLPLTIAADDGRLHAVEQYLAAFDCRAKVADVGCGPGRFLHALVKHYPAFHFVGIDAATSVLEHLPPECERRSGALLRLPAADGEFDAAFAVESLEHALLPQQAIHELCRIVRPGGRILIIDKHAARQPFSMHQPWEHWFLPEAVIGWLAPYCRDITCRPLSHGPTAEYTGLFLCWEAARIDERSSEWGR
jgi:malonyl-CoA O-methyltransferase